MNRNELQGISRTRVREARALLKNGSYAGSFYLMGYAIECAIKAAIAKKTKAHDFPNKKLAHDSYSHDLEKLIKTAGLWVDLEDEMKANTNLARNWTVVKDWTEESRYTLTTSKLQAQDLYSACTARKHGLLSWLKRFW